MARLSNEGRRLAYWLRQQLQEYQLSTEKAAKAIGISLSSMKRLLSGQTEWSRLGDDLRAAIQEVLGEFPINAEPALPGNREYRPIKDGLLDFDYLISLDLTDDLLDQSLGGPDEEQPPQAREDDRSSPPADAGVWIESICSKCRTPIPIVNNGKCPNPECRRIADGAQ